MLVCTEENLVLYLAVLSVEAKQRLNHFKVRREQILFFSGLMPSLLSCSPFLHVSLLLILAEKTCQHQAMPN